MRKSLLKLAGCLDFVLLLAVAPAGPQVTSLQVRHRAGQTFITWKEVDSPLVDDQIDDAGVRGLVRELDDGKLRYRIYRSGEPIRSLEGLAVLAEVRPLSCWNIDYYGLYAKKGEPAVRYVIADGAEPLPVGTGLYVHNPALPAGAESAKAYYVVTVVEDGTENTALGESNATAAPVVETRGQGVPVLQRIVKPESFAYIDKPELHYYVRWEAPPNSSVENRPIDYLVAVPPNIAARPTPVGLHLHCWGGSLNGGYGWWYHYGELGTTYLISSNQVPYDWWTGYHELYYSGRPDEQRWKQGVVRPYTTTRMLSFLDWAAEKYQLDLNRVFAAGSSMGGSGAPMFAIRYPGRIAWAIGWVGVHDPGNTPQFTGSYERVYGKRSWGIRYEDGTPVFEYYKDAAFLLKYPEKEIGFVTWSNAKNDGGIGWPQAVEFFRAMQRSRRPHIFVWGLAGHGQRASMPAGGGQRVMPIDIRLDQSIPAFTDCSLDDDPGTARRLPRPREVRIGKEARRDPFDGDSAGQANLYLYWRTEDVVEQAGRWEMTVGLTDQAPQDKCSVDITPRRLQNFRVRPGQTYNWTNSAGGKLLQAGRATADRWGLVTLEDVIVTKRQNRISIRQ